MMKETEYTKDDIISFLGESFHTAFRKSIDSDIGHEIWKLIRKMPREEWGAVLGFVYWCMGPEYADVFKVKSE